MNGFFQSSAIQKEKPAGTIAKCGSCGLFKKCQSPKIEVQGNGARGVLIVGEAPGETEDKKGILFSGKAGQLLWETLDTIRIDLDEDTWFTNALICHTPATPDSKQIEYCHPNLVNTIKKLKPKTIITLGRFALSSVLTGYWKDVGVMDRWVGWQIPLAKHWVCPTYDPAFLLRKHDSFLNRLFKENLRSAFELEERPPAQPDWEGQIEILLDEDSACEAIKTFDIEDDWLAYDFETNCIKPEWPKGKIFACALSNGRRTIAYPWWGKAIKYTGKLLASKNTRKIASNLKMEQRWTLKAFGHGAARWGWDTMLAAHALDNRSGICSLKFQSLVRLGVPAYNTHVEPYLGATDNYPYNNIKQIELRQLLLYNGMDALLEYHLAMIQRKDMNQGLTRED